MTMRVDSRAASASRSPTTATAARSCCCTACPTPARLWRRQVTALTDAGLRMSCPTSAASAPPTRPSDVEPYDLPFLAADVLAVLDHLGIDRAHVVGHDWGAALAWAIAALAPDRVDHLAALSVGHPPSFAGAGLAQREKSWYMLLFQFAGIAEQWLSTTTGRTSRAGADHPDLATRDRRARPARAAHRRAQLVPGQRAARSPGGPAAGATAVQAPTMGVWSSGDIALTETQMTGSAAFVNGPFRYERLDGVGHWMPLEAPDEVNRLLLDFLPR